MIGWLTWKWRASVDQHVRRSEKPRPPTRQQWPKRESYQLLIYHPDVAEENNTSAKIVSDPAAWSRSWAALSRNLAFPMGMAIRVRPLRSGLSRVGCQPGCEPGCQAPPGAPPWLKPCSRKFLNLIPIAPPPSAPMVGRVEAEGIVRFGHQ